MKTKLIGIVALCCMAIGASAQWSQTGSKVYTTNKGYDVGIGTGTAVKARLHVKRDTCDTIPLVIFQHCDTASTDILQWRRGNNDYGVFDEDGKVGIYETDPLSRLAVGGQGSTDWEASFYNDDSDNYVVGGRGEAAKPTTGSYHAYGLYGLTESGNGYTYGTYGRSYTNSSSSGRAYGVYGYAGNATGGYNYGVYGKIAGSNDGAGVFGTESSDVSTTSSCSAGKYAGFFYGDFGTSDSNPECSGGGSFSACSDKRLKTNIDNFEDGLEVIKKINPVTFQYNGLGCMPTDETFIGVIAQDVQKIAPYCIDKKEIVVDAANASNFDKVRPYNNATDTSEANFAVEVLTYNYDGLIYALINSAKELDSANTLLEEKLEEKSKQIENLQNQVGDLQGQMEELKAALNSQGIGTEGEIQNNEVELGDNSSQGIILHQNDPNPFKEKTSISYFIPEGTGQSKVIIYNQSGSVVKEVIVTDGYGKVDVFASDLSTGVYTYSIVSGDKVIDTKKMMVTK